MARRRMWRSCCWATRRGASKYHTEPDRVINSKDVAPRNLLLRFSTQLSTQLTKIAESHQDAKRVTERTKLGSRTPREGVPVGVVRRQGQGQRQSPRRAVLSAATLGRILMWLAMILSVTAATWNNGTLVQGAGAPDAPRNRGLQQSLSWQRAVWYGPGCAS